MIRRSRLWTIGALFAALSLVIVTCSGADGAEATSTTASVESTETATTTTAPPVIREPAVEVHFFALCEASGHNDADAFRHWDGDDPAVVPETCAKCQVGTGFHASVGADGSATGVVDAAHDPDTSLTCTTCHNDMDLLGHTVSPQAS